MQDRQTATRQNIFGMNSAVQSSVWTTRPRILVSSDKPCWIWAEIPVEYLQRLVARMPLRLAAIIAARGGNTHTHAAAYTKSHQQAVSCKKSTLFDQIYHSYHPMTFRYAHTANFSNISKCHHKFTKVHFKQNSVYNTYKNLKSCKRACL